MLLRLSIPLFLLCVLSGCVTEEWVKDYVASQTKELKTIDKDVADNKARVAALGEDFTTLRQEVKTSLEDCKARLDSMRHDLNHVDTKLHEFSSKTQEAMTRLETDVHRDAATQESRVAVLLDKIQRLDAEAVKLRESIQSIENRVQELGDILHPLTGKEVKRR
jgi:septal ring factor EnvC (AmiA/AmiB activator)